MSPELRQLIEVEADEYRTQSEILAELELSRIMEKNPLEIEDFETQMRLLDFQQSFRPVLY